MNWIDRILMVLLLNTYRYEVDLVERRVPWQDEGWTVVTRRLGEGYPSRYSESRLPPNGLRESLHRDALHVRLLYQVHRHRPSLAEQYHKLEAKREKSSPGNNVACSHGSVYQRTCPEGSGGLGQRVSNGAAALAERYYCASDSSEKR